MMNSSKGEYSPTPVMVEVVAIPVNVQPNEYNSSNNNYDGNQQVVANQAQPQITYVQQPQYPQQQVVIINNGPQIIVGGGVMPVIIPEEVAYKSPPPSFTSVKE